MYHARFIYILLSYPMFVFKKIEEQSYLQNKIRKGCPVSVLKDWAPFGSGGGLRTFSMNEF